MFSLTSQERYFLFGGPTDMRKSFDGLCGLVREKMGRDPLSGEVYVFINRRRDKIKLLRWERGGFTLYYKRLEVGTFTTATFDGESYHMPWADLVMMVEGIEIGKARYKERYYPQQSVDK